MSNRMAVEPEPLPAWTLDDAEARFGDLVRTAQDGGPQRVSIHGHDDIVVMSERDFARLSPPAVPAPTPTSEAPANKAPLSLLDLFASAPPYDPRYEAPDAPRVPEVWRDLEQF